MKSTEIICKEAQWFVIKLNLKQKTNKQTKKKK